MSALGITFSASHVSQAIIQVATGTLRGPNRDFKVTVLSNIVGLIHKIYEFFLSLITPKASLELIDDFEKIIDDGEVTHDPDPREVAAAKILGDDYLTSSTVHTFASALQKQRPVFHFVSDFLYSRQKAIDVPDDLPAYIPFILEGKTFHPDHIVILVLDPSTKTYEYYNSQGGALKDEKRIVLGTDLPASNLLDERFRDWTPKSNPTRHQTDHVNCGRFVTWFMKQRTKRYFDEICQIPKVDILRVKEELAAYLN